jgi:hypothetical protein
MGRMRWMPTLACWTSTALGHEVELLLFAYKQRTMVADGLLDLDFGGSTAFS